MRYVCNGANLGIAEAQNIGIRIIGHQWPDTTHIVFLDQDSEVDDDYVQAITKEHRRISQHVPLFLLGPLVENKATLQTYDTLQADNNYSIDNFLPQREIINSGSCAPLATLKELGMMRGEMFIDYVDFELCWRAASKGYVNGITLSLCLPHQVGHHSVRFLGKPIIVSAPFRYYFQWRNLLALRRLPYTPKAWVRKKLLRKAAEMLLLPFITKDGWQILRQSVRGISAGLKFRL